jgi:hypothetical protein
VITVPPEETIPIGDFPLVWRWTSETHAVFTPAELASMRAINERASATLHDYLLSQGLMRREPDPVSFQEVALDAEHLSEERVAAWLCALPVVQEERAWVCYPHWSNSVEVPWDLFVQRWDDFCYPSSDDVVVVPPSGAWVLEYWHYETLIWLPR